MQRRHHERLPQCENQLRLLLLQLQDQLLLLCRSRHGVRRRGRLGVGSRRREQRQGGRGHRLLCCCRCWTGTFSQNAGLRCRRRGCTVGSWMGQGGRQGRRRRRGRGGGAISRGHCGVRPLDQRLSSSWEGRRGRLRGGQHWRLLRGHWRRGVPAAAGPVAAAVAPTGGGHCEARPVGASPGGGVECRALDWRPIVCSVTAPNAARQCRRCEEHGQLPAAQSTRPACSPPPPPWASVRRRGDPAELIPSLLSTRTLPL